VVEECLGVETLDREAVPRDVRDGGCRGRGCADAEEATTGEVEFIARVEEVAGPEYARFACPEAGRGPSSSSAGREVQLPYRERQQRVSTLTDRARKRCEPAEFYSNRSQLRRSLWSSSRERTHHGSYCEMHTRSTDNSEGKKNL
jgi:hypothetical protein